MIDVAAGDKIPRKGGPGITRSDLLVINKIDLAPYVGASLEVMDRDAEEMRGERPFVFTNLKSGAGSTPWSASSRRRVGSGRNADLHATFRRQDRPHQPHARNADRGRLDRSRRGGNAPPYRGARRDRRAAPLSVPVFYRVAYTTDADDGAQVLGPNTSGEVEPVIVALADGLWIGLGSDHTDRKAETISVALSKQLCGKVIGSALWRFDEISGDWDRIVIRSHAVIGGARMLYQEGPLAGIRHPEI